MSLVAAVLECILGTYYSMLVFRGFSLEIVNSIVIIANSIVNSIFTSIVPSIVNWIVSSIVNVFVYSFVNSIMSSM